MRLRPRGSKIGLTSDVQVVNELQPEGVQNQQREIVNAIEYNHDVQEAGARSQHQRSNGSEARHFSASPQRGINSEDEAQRPRKESLSSEGLNLTSNASTAGLSLARRFKAMRLRPEEDASKQIYLEDIAPAGKMGGEKTPEGLQFALNPHDSLPDEAQFDDESLLGKRGVL